MKKENLTPAEIDKFNANVEFNESAASWVMDIVFTLSFANEIIFHA